MEFPLRFIAAGTAFTTLRESVPAPYLRRSFTLDARPEEASLVICGLGFYELYVNGRRITRTKLAPYINNPDDILYYDRYDVKDLLTDSENVIGVWLGNGFFNNPGGYVWEFDKARWRGAPRMALRMEAALPGGGMFELYADERFKAADSPVYHDDYRGGEYYDARLEIPGWNEPGFDDSGWRPAIFADPPRGEARLCGADPIVITEERTPVSIREQEGGWLYDFGINMAGVCRLRITGEPGQKIYLYHGEHIREDGTLNRRNISFNDNDYVQKDSYICKGGGTEEYVPTFTYHGFQYVLVKGFTAAQAAPEALTYLVMNTRLTERGGFSCSNDTINTLQTLVRRSTLSNFHHFPTDCPQREKNGWTADAALSAEHTLLGLSPETNYREWMHNIRKAQAEQGSLPGIVPTAGWGFQWGNGPAWDSVLVYLPYFTYLYRGDRAIVEENATAILRYLNYLDGRIGDRGLIAIGLGDWCQPNRPADGFIAPLALTDTILSMDMCDKAAYLFGELGLSLQRDFAMGLYKKLRGAIREHLLDLNTMTAAGNCQTSQAMAIFYDAFEPGEKPAAFRRLLDFIRQAKDHLDVGVLGGRVLFHVLAAFGEIELALKMITRADSPSYGHWVARGATSLWEDFHDNTAVVNSLNHHFWGDISHFFIRHLAGIHYNPHRKGGLEVRPQFPASLTYAEGFHLAPQGEIRVRWQRTDGGVTLDVTAPQTLEGVIRLPAGYAFPDGKTEIRLAGGAYELKAV